jgi:hypothetical protein
VIGVPNVDKNEPYETQAYAFVVLDGAQGPRAAVGAQARGLRAAAAHCQSGRWAGGRLVPAQRDSGADPGRHQGNRRPEIIASVPDGYVYAVGPGGKRLWRYDYARGTPKTFASEVVAADLNRDAVPELVFGTYGANRGAGRLVVLAASGRRLFEIRLRHQSHDANGIGIAAAPSIADLNRDGRRDRRFHDRPWDRRHPRPARQSQPPAMADRPRQPAA